MKKVIKFVAALVGGMCGGYLLALLGIALFGDASFAELLSNLKGAKFTDMLLSALVAIATILVGLPFLVITHEAGHLVCGLMSGYQFVSFRIFSFTFVRQDGKLRVKRYAIAGTEGQCLLAPPDRPIEEIPVGWYNAGGVLANLLVVLAAVPFLWLSDNAFVREALVVYIVLGAALILLNGIPFQVNGTGNDAYNMLFLSKTPASKRGLLLQLRANALIQEGVRPKDMPAEWFVVPPQIDYRNALEVAVPLLDAARRLDMMDFDGALSEYEQLYVHKELIAKLYVLEMEGEMVFLYLATGQADRARELLTPELRKYIDNFRKVMSSKERILFAIALVLDDNRPKAVEILENLRARAPQYLLQGEVASDLAAMEQLLASRPAEK